MEVIDDSSAMLSNYEVYSLLTDIQNGTNGQKKPSKHQSNLATISYSTLKFLEKTPCASQNPEIVERFLMALEPFQLTKAEKLQFLNHLPCTDVEIQLMVEESEERLSEEQIGQLLVIVGGLKADLGGEEQAAEGQEAMDTVGTS